MPPAQKVNELSKYTKPPYWSSRIVTSMWRVNFAFAMVIADTTQGRWSGCGQRRRWGTYCECTAMECLVLPPFWWEATSFLWSSLAKMAGQLHVWRTLNWAQPRPESSIWSAYISWETSITSASWSTLTSVNTIFSSTKAACVSSMCLKQLSMIIHKHWSFFGKIVQTSLISSTVSRCVPWVSRTCLTLWQMSQSLMRILSSTLRKPNKKQSVEVKKKLLRKTKYLKQYSRMCSYPEH